VGLVTWCTSSRSDGRVSTDIITGARWYKRLLQRVTKHNPPVGKILTLSSRPTTLDFGMPLDGHIPGLRGTEVSTALQKVGVDSYDHIYRDCQNEGIRLRQLDDRTGATPRILQVGCKKISMSQSAIESGFRSSGSTRKETAESRSVR